DQLVTQEYHGRQRKQRERRQIQNAGTPAMIFEQAISHRINCAKVQQQRRKEYERGSIEEGDRQIEIPIGSQWRVKVEDKGDYAKPCEMQNKRGASALTENYKQPDEQPNDPD